MSAQSCCVTVCPERDMTALHLLQHQGVALPCKLFITSLLLETHVTAGKGSALLFVNCGGEPWLSIASWLPGLEIPILLDLRNNKHPLPLKHFKAISRQTYRQEHTGWKLQTLHSIAPQLSTKITSWSERNFQSFQNSFCVVAEWLKRAQGPEEWLFSRPVMLVL